MTTRTESYVGVSGVVRPEQQQRLIELSELAGLPQQRRRLLLGIKATHKTQYLDIENKYGSEWYPVGDTFSTAVDSRVLATKHVAQVYLEPAEAQKDPRYPYEFIEKLHRRGNPILDGVQFDMLPYHEDVSRWGNVINAARKITEHDDLEIIVQCHKMAMEAGPAAAVDTLKRLTDVAKLSYVLFDSSHGTGKEMESDRLRQYLEVAYSDNELAGRGINFGIAGGLDAGAVERHLPSIVGEFPDVSWDAEGRLHQTPSGVLDNSAARDYLFASARVLAGD